MVKKYVPKQGDIIYIDLDPTVGHEQKGKRPAMVISTSIFNKFSNMAFVCPITSTIKDFPTHYVLEDSKKIKGSVLCEHLRSIDFADRQINFVEKATNNDLLSVMMLVNACIEE